MCEIAEVYKIDARKARKDHNCVECRGTIKTGEIYRFHHGVFDGSGFSAKVCLECDELRDEVNKTADRYDQCCVGEVCEWASEGGDELLRKFMDIKIKRGAKVPDWMIQRLSEPEDEQALKVL